MTTASHAPRGPGVWGTAALLCLLPIVTYASVIFRRYGLRDDYAILREAEMEPGKIFRVCASQGRPLYGALLELSTRLAGDIDGLSGLRLLGVVALGLLAASVFLLLLGEGWRPAPAALLAAFLPLAPSAQVIANWGICWPQAPALLMGIGAFALARRGLPWPPQPLPRSHAWRIAAVGAMALATLTYQASGLFYAVLVAAALVARRESSLRDTAHWLARHLLVMGLGLTLAFGLTKLAFALGWLNPSVRMVFEKHWLDKFAWALTHVLPNALALSVLNSSPGTPSPDGYRLMVGVTLVLLGAGLAVEFQRAGHRGVGRWLLGLVMLSAITYSVSFLAGERWPSYRTIYALTGVWSVFFVASIVNLGGVWPSRGPRVATLLLGGLVATSALLAHQQSLELFALPQARELALMEEGARQVVPETRRRVFVRYAKQTDTSAPRRYLDEFGSVSVDAEWVAKEMLRELVQERFPQERDVSRLYRFAGGQAATAPSTYDILVDMRRLRPGAEHPRGVSLRQPPPR
ncbi:hypothetical protein D187_003598 [Cystobacter fuscus DSM 2262]|uniref:Uncharacterized protein n=1 Tax=Cystobacter fuscus (strain ATCC 25194 / DSM 2262 / NBRC 100088 / M29) TaxID=1242864 RepID=S9QQJ4_CYSF2|nr:hypothetical protein [Cystobacter fuscus]EPX58883.1 hypothetical protein D187_003598 [Cystobacter fuscus DSM 2262]